MNTIENKKIAIVGGGPGGLTLARLLQMNGADINVYERDVNKDVRVQGATLDLHDDSGLRALREAGLMEAFKENFRPGADKMRITDRTAKIIYDQHEEVNEETFGAETFRPEIDRGPLRTILLESLKPDTVIWDRYLTQLVSSGSGWKLEFQNSTSAYADIAIAADGASSKIRPLITSIQPFYSGVTVVEGAVYHSETTAPVLHQLVKGGKVFAFGDEKSLILSAKGDGSLVFYTGHKASEDWVANSGIDFKDKAQVAAWFKKEFAGWDSLWQELFDKASGAFVPRPQYCMPPDQTWEALPNLTLLGDAAHLMPPYAGEGVNMAMLDALELSHCLTHGEFADVHTAIAAYENQMRERASSIARMTLEQTELLHSADAIKNMMTVMGQ